MAEKIHKWLMLLILFVVHVSFLSCSNIDSYKRIDLDIRTLELLPTIQSKEKLILLGESGGIGRLKAEGYFVDTIYYQKGQKLNFVFFRVHSADGVTGADYFIFFDSGNVYRVRISNELSPDQKHYVSVFKYSKDSCLNLEGKVHYHQSEDIQELKDLDMKELVNSVVEIDSNSFKVVAKDFRLTSYL